MIDGHLHKGLENMKTMILSLASLVEDRFKSSREAIENLDTDLADEIINKDYEIDDMEVEIEEECLKALALYQPVAIDLRFIITLIKINNDLERIGDLAVNIAQCVKKIAENRCDFVFDYYEMAEEVQYMLHKCLDSFVNMDAESALKVCKHDDHVDQLKSSAYEIIKKEIQAKPDYIGCLINMLLISRHLERIADHSTNIAEDVIYMVKGEIVRHFGPS